MKTYSHLESAQRMPTEYELLTSRLLYYPGKGFEVASPAAAWYEQYQKGSPLTCRDWERFGDPRETTYSRYVATQKNREIFVDHLLESAENSGYDAALPPAWLRILERVLAPLRYPGHGLQMAASYVAHMAPCGRIVVAAMLQAADEIRRVQRLAYRMRQLQIAHPGFGEGSRAAWQDDPLWQPLRLAVERLLAAYDWGESFVALNLVLKPMVDELWMTHLARLARSEGDDILERMFFSLNRDCRWHRQWSQALVRTALEDRPENKAVIEGWIRKWLPLAEGALEAFGPVFDRMPQRPGAVPFSGVRTAVRRFHADYCAAAGLGIG